MDVDGDRTILCETPKYVLNHYNLNSCQSPHVTTFVSRISVRCVSETVPSCFSARATLSTEQPHFSILGTSHVPFLTRVTIEWTGGSTKDLEVDHWVNVW